MDENIHNNDDLFRKAYQNFEEEPSPDVWDRLNAKLDKKDAIYYRNRFAWWRNVAVMLIVLLGSFAAYELFMSKTTSNSTNTATGNVQTKQSAGDVADQQENGSGTDDTKKSVTENDKSASNEQPSIKQDDQKLNKLIDKKQNFNIHKIIPANKANEKADGDRHATAFGTKEDSSSESIEFRRSDVNKTVIVGKNNVMLNDSSGYAFTELKTKDSINKPTIPADTKTIKLTGLAKSHWSFSPYTAIGFPRYFLDNDNAFRGPNEPDDRNKINERERHELSYSFGLFARYHFTRSFNIKTGLSYSNIAIGILPQTLHTSAANDHQGYKFVTSDGYTYLQKAFGTMPSAGDSIHAENTEHHTAYLDIPLMAAYTINPASRLTIRPGAGIATHIFLGSKAETDIKKDNKTEHISLTNFKGQSPVYFSVIGDAELNYRFNKKLSLLFLPSFNYAINSITNKNVVRTYPYGLQLSAGVTWSLD